MGTGRGSGCDLGTRQGVQSGWRGEVQGREVAQVLQVAKRIKKENAPADLGGRVDPEATSLWALERRGKRPRRRAN